MSKTEATSAAASGPTPGALSLDAFDDSVPVQVQIERDERGRPYPITAVLCTGRLRSGVNTPNVENGVVSELYFVGIGNAKRGRHIVLDDSLWLQGTKNDEGARGVAAARAKLFGMKTFVSTADGSKDGELVLESAEAFVKDLVEAGGKKVVQLVIEDDPRRPDRDLFRIRYVNEHPQGQRAQALLERDDVKSWIAKGLEKALERIKSRDAGLADGDDLYDDEDLDF